MDININVKIDSPNIVNAVLALAEALEKMKAEVQINSGFKNPHKEVQAPKENLQNNEKSKTPTLEEVRSVTAKISQNGKQFFRLSIYKYCPKYNFELFQLIWVE